MFLEGYKRNWLYTEGYAFEDRMIDDLSVSLTSRLRSLKYDYLGPGVHLPHTRAFQKAMEQEEGDEEEEKETKPDPLHQLILHFSRTALTEKRWIVRSGSEMPLGLIPSEVIALILSNIQ